MHLKRAIGRGDLAKLAEAVSIACLQLKDEHGMLTPHFINLADKDHAGMSRIELHALSAVAQYVGYPVECDGVLIEPRSLTR